MGNIGGQALDSLIRALKDDHELVREQAIAALTKLADKNAIDPLLEATKDKSPDVRKAAADFFAAVPDAKAINVLVPMLKDDNKGVRESVARTLQGYGEKVLDPLIKALTDENVQMRVSASIVLGHMGDKKALDPLIKALKDASEIVRARAAEALGNIGDIKAIDPLVQAAKDENEFVRMSATAALTKVKASGEKVSREAAGFQCPRCGRAIKEPTTSKSTAIIFIMLGILLSPVLIGIPLLLYGWNLKTNKRGYWLCKRCGHKAPLRWYD
jgi:vesicle coat complex subunit